MTHFIDTTRLRLRPPGIGDAARVTDFLGNFAVSGNLARVPHPYTIDDARAWLGNWRAGRHPADTNFVIDLKGTGAVGCIGFDSGRGPAELGYWLGEPFWGQGIMSEASRAVVDWFFTATSADLITSGVFHFNMASLAIQQKLGFVETGRSQRHSLARGEHVEHIDTELTKEAFEDLAPNVLKAANS